MDELRVKLGRSADELQRYAQTSGLMFAGENTNVSDAKLRELQSELSRAQAERVLKQSTYEAAVAIAPDLLPEVLDNTAVRNTQGRLTEMKVQLADLSTLLTPENYKVQRLQAQIAELEKTLKTERTTTLDRIRIETESAQRREAALTKAYIAQGKLVNEDAVKAIRYDLLKREVDANRQLYDSMLQKVKEAGVVSAMRASNIRVIDPAEPPFVPFKPNPSLNFTMAILSGLLLGVTFAFVADQFDRTFRLPGDSIEYLKVPELGLIPLAAVDPTYQENAPRRLRFLSANARGSDFQPTSEINAWEQNGSLLAESFRGLVASIVLPKMFGERPRAIVITSPRSKDGKEHSCCQFGGGSGENEAPGAAHRRRYPAVPPTHDFQCRAGAGPHGISAGQSGGRKL